jgi:hypothetical protein
LVLKARRKTTPLQFAMRSRPDKKFVFVLRSMRSTFTEDKEVGYAFPASEQCAQVVRRASTRPSQVPKHGRGLLERGPMNTESGRSMGHITRLKNSRVKNNLVGRCFADQNKRASLHASIRASSSSKQLIHTVSIWANGNKIIDCYEPLRPSR